MEEGGVFGLYGGVAWYQTGIKPLPGELSLAGPVRQANEMDAEFLWDLTFMDGDQRVSQQRIFDRALKLIEEAEDFLLLDCFLFNEFLGKERSAHRRLCSEITSALLQKKRERPQIQMVVISDPVNEAYGGPVPPHFKSLREAGIPVVLTDLRKLRDSNPMYSSFWRLGIQWFGNSRSGSLPHPFSKEAGGVSLRSWLALLNFKANHRKLILADTPGNSGRREIQCLVMSANPHDASSAHNNIGLQVRGDTWKDLLRGEQAILQFSGSDIDLNSWLPKYAEEQELHPVQPASSRKITVQVLSEQQIRKGLLSTIDEAQPGDAMDLAMFYLSERHVLESLVAAANRGVSVRLLLDPNRDAFGYEKNGIPNRPVAAELLRRAPRNLEVRWFKTHGEQFHTKMLISRSRGNATLFAGSANFTRRNIGDYNLETDLVVAGESSAAPLAAASSYFEKLWQAREHEFSVPYEFFADPSRMHYWEYRIQEQFGLSTF